MTIQTELNTKIKKSITALGKSEKLTKGIYSVLSRDILTYIGLNGSNDIDTVNRTLGVLTVANRKSSILFFDHFLPFKLDKKAGTFGHKLKGDKLLTAYDDKLKEFMADDGNDIWSWIDRNVTHEDKAKDFSTKLTNLVKRSLSDDKEAIDHKEVLAAVMSGGVSLKDLWSIIGDLQESMKAPANVSVEHAITDMEELVAGGVMSQAARDASIGASLPAEA